MKKIGNNETFQKIADQWKNFPIKNLKQAEKFLKLLKEETNGLVIIDFLDMRNWDCFESFSINESSSILEISWHDYREQDKKENNEELSRMVFPASLYSAILKFQSIDIHKLEELVFFSIRGYSLTTKDIIKELKPNTEEFNIQLERPFSISLIRKKEGLWLVNECINSPLFTILIVPKGRRIPTSFSQAVLYHCNIENVEKSVIKVEGSLKSIDDDDTDAICEKANTLRRSMENLLKIELCYRDITPSKNYSQMLIGDLWKLLKDFHSEEIKQIISKFIQLSNELSHDSGISVDKTKCEFVAVIIKMYLKLFYDEMIADFNYPRRKPFDDKYIAF